MVVEEWRGKSKNWIMVQKKKKKNCDGKGGAFERIRRYLSSSPSFHTKEWKLSILVSFQLFLFDITSHFYVSVEEKPCFCPFWASAPEGTGGDEVL